MPECVITNPEQIPKIVDALIVIHDELVALELEAEKVADSIPP